MAIYDVTNVTDHTLKSEFRLFDLDGDGYVELRELKLAVSGTQSGRQLTEEDLQVYGSG